MAYSNWDAKVFRNSKRMMNREDVAVYDEEEAVFPKWARIWANLMKNKEKNNNKWWKHSQRDEYYEKSYLEKEGSIEINNKIWKWYFVMEENSITILLIEPDGTKWKGIGGYVY